MSLSRKLLLYDCSPYVRKYTNVSNVSCMSMWVHEYYKDREYDGEFLCVYKKIRIYPDQYYNYARMSTDLFDLLQGKLKDKLERTSTNFRDAICAKQRLILTIRCSDTYESQNCGKSSQGYNILPPIQSAEIKTKHFSFKYGIVEIKAKLPEGDWIVPYLQLESKDREYGPNLNSGKIVIAQAVGNKELFNRNGTNISGRNLKSIIEVGVGTKTFQSILKRFNKSALWSNGYHIYKVIWTPDSIDFGFDNYDVKKLLNNITYDNPLGKRFHFTDDEIRRIWGENNQLAPFDKEFRIVLGLTVGGDAFPDNCTTNENHKKPWNSTDAKYLFQFWKDRDNWHSTWKGNNSALIVEYVKVWSL